MLGCTRPDYFAWNGGPILFDDRAQLSRIQEYHRRGILECGTYSGYVGTKKSDPETTAQPGQKDHSHDD